MSAEPEAKGSETVVAAIGLGGALLIGLAVWFATSEASVSPPAGGGGSTPGEVDDARAVRPPETAHGTFVARAARYLVDHTQPDGTYVYRVNLNPKISVEPRYNILRHAGALYALGMYLERYPDPEVKQALLSAAGYLRREAYAALPSEPGLAGIWSWPEVNRTGKPAQVKLGGAGLGLVGLLMVERIEPGFTPKADLQALARFLVYMQKPDGSFYSKYIPATGGRDDSWVSLYYPGEAALGLLMLHELDPDPRWLQAAGATLGFLCRSRETVAAKEIPIDHWALLATEQLLPHVQRGAELGVSAEQLLRHATQISEAILATRVLDGPARLKGGFSAGGRTTPTATRLEGLLAARAFLPAEHPLRPQIDAAVEGALAFLVPRQIDKGPHIGGVTRAVMLIDRDDPLAVDFNRRVAEIRIDYVQHAMCAVMQRMDQGD